MSLILSLFEILRQVLKSFTSSSKKIIVPKKHGFLDKIGTLFLYGLIHQRFIKKKKNFTSSCSPLLQLHIYIVLSPSLTRPYTNYFITSPLPSFIPFIIHYLSFQPFTSLDVSLFSFSYSSLHHPFHFARHRRLDLIPHLLQHARSLQGSR